MSPRRSSIAVAVLISSCGIIAAPLAFVCENYPEWAAVAFGGIFLSFNVVIGVSVFAIKRRRPEQLAQLGVSLAQRQWEMCRACGIFCLGMSLGTLGGNFRAIGLVISLPALFVSIFLAFRCWPDKAESNDGGNQPIAPPAA
jgi:hypothetical protein